MIRFERQDALPGFRLAEPEDESRFLTALLHRKPYQLVMLEGAADPTDKRVRQLWVKDTSASSQFNHGGVFALRLLDTNYYLSLLPQDNFDMLKLKPVNLHPVELVCEELQWEETDGVIRKPAAHLLPNGVN